MPFPCLQSRDASLDKGCDAWYECNHPHLTPHTPSILLDLPSRSPRIVSMKSRRSRSGWNEYRSGTVHELGFPKLLPLAFPRARKTDVTRRGHLSPVDESSSGSALRRTGWGSIRPTVRMDTTANRILRHPHQASKLSLRLRQPLFGSKRKERRKVRSRWMAEFLLHGLMLHSQP